MPTEAFYLTDSQGNRTTVSADFAVQSATVIECVDFAAANSSGFWMPNGVTGAGVDAVVYQMRPNTSTKAATVNALTSGQTNPYRLMKVGSTNSGSPALNLNVSGFTLQGTDQGSNYGGLDILYANSPQIHDLKILGPIPGNGAGPPGETFLMHTQRTNNPTFYDIVLDGRDDTGTPVAGTLNGNSYLVNGGTWTRVQHLYAGSGFGTAIFQASGSQPYTWTDCTWVGCRKAFNLEDSLVPGPYVFNRPTFGPTTGTGMGEVMQVSSKTSSAQVRINDPILTGGLTWPLKVRWYPNSGTPQQGSDIKLFIGGVDKTADPTKLQLVNY